MGHSEQGSHVVRLRFRHHPYPSTRGAHLSGNVSV